MIGRKNWLFSETPEGAKASAFLYTLVETAKANNIEPFWYLKYLFEKHPLAGNLEEKRNLLPMYIDLSKAQLYKRQPRSKSKV